MTQINIPTNKFIENFLPNYKKENRNCMNAFKMCDLANHGKRNDIN